ncbi:MAG: carbohydrate ABC transporter permease, partial [Anaerolineae bacterium]|nr:carbohydrate ABC transporter permease [Anaerolineae bacterium]
MANTGNESSRAFQVRRFLARGLLYLILILGAAVMVLPFVFMVSTSVMTLGESNTGRFLPRFVRLACPYVNLPSYQEGTVIGFSVSPTLRPGAQELPTDAYYVLVEQAEGSGEWLFQLIDNRNNPVEIAPVDNPDGAFTADWQPFPAGGGGYDTRRGMSITFAPPGAYEAAGRRSGAARIDYVNCCEYPTDVAERLAAQRAERTYAGRPIPEDLSACRTAGNKISYFFQEFIGGNYYQAWFIANFREYMGNSVIITLVTLAGMLVTSTLAAYAFARMQFPGRTFLFAVLLSTMMIPETVTMIPNFLTITGNNPLLPFINWYDKLPALTVPFMAGFFNIFLLRQFFA